jgi:glycosyltransferase involved in cell wall biosynthesis
MVNVSAIIATKNGERFIGRAIRSVLCQEGADLEVIVVDDASTDGTAGIVRVIAQEDARVRYFYHVKNEGPAKARNFAVAQAKGEYIAVIDDDDEWSDTNKLKDQMGFLNTHLDHVLVGAANVDIVDEEGGILFKQHYPKSDDEIRNGILSRNYFTHSGVMYRKNIFEKLDGYKNMRLAEDYDLWLRMGSAGKFANLDTFRINWTYRKGSASAKKKWKMNLVTLRLIWTYRKQYPHSVRALVRGVARLAWYGVFGLSSPYMLIRKNGFLPRSKGNKE